MAMVIVESKPEQRLPR